MICVKHWTHGRYLIVGKWHFCYVWEDKKSIVTGGKRGRGCAKSSFHSACFPGPCLNINLS